MNDLFKNKITICYFGNYDYFFSRNTIYVSGLRKIGVNVIECNTTKGKIMKYVDLFIKHWRVRNNYDYIIVGYPDRLSVLFAKLISRKSIIFNALCSMYEIVVISRSQFSKKSLVALLYKMLDYAAVKCADLILVETDAQKKYFIDNFGARSDSCFKLYTGVDDSIFYIDSAVSKEDMFTVLFRGKFLPEAGVRHIIKAAKLLEDKNINFLLLGGGPHSEEIKNLIKILSPKNLTVISEKLSSDDLRKMMLSSHISLGQFENNERLDRTIPHKASESLAMKLPYITGRSNGISELVVDNESCLMVNLADPIDLAEKILVLKDNPVLMKKLTENGYKIYKENLKPEVIARELVRLLGHISKK